MVVCAREHLDLLQEMLHPSLVQSSDKLVDYFALPEGNDGWQ